jgi:uroporphyrinogen decarboxylase
MVPSKQAMTDSVAAQQTKSTFLRSCQLLKNDYTPIWLMRQAGRFMPEYRAIREKLSFLELCKQSDAAAEITVLAVEKLQVDAAIIFADILLLLEPMGIGLEFTQADGPCIRRPVRTANDVDQIRTFSPEEELAFVYKAIALTRKALAPDIALIGFAGAPFTLASYLIEGGSSRHFDKTKTFMYIETTAWHKLMSRLADLTLKYLLQQIKFGAQTVQLFDSWVGCLSCDDYNEYVLPYVSKIIAGIKGLAPIIYFGTGTAALLPLICKADPNVIGLDWRVDLGLEWSKIGYDVAVQGNLDPVVLLAGKEEIVKSTERILNRAARRPGHIFNLGHGVLPQTPVDNVRFLVDTVHSLSSK